MSMESLQAGAAQGGARRRFALVLGYVVGVAPCLAAAPPDSAAGGITTYRGEHVQGTLHVHEIVPSESLGTRRVLVWLPASYAWDQDRRYPVLYGLDGQNLFDARTAAGEDEWMLDELLIRRPEGVAETIVVGIPSGAHVVQEYAPPGSHPGGRADALVRFVATELKPWIDATYRTRVERSHTMLMGVGTSALAAVYAAWTRADVFRGAIALEFPDVDTRSVVWSTAPPVQRPWIWLEQKAAEKSRPSTTQLLADLQRHADVRVVIPGPGASRPTRIAAALRARP